MRIITCNIRYFGAADGDNRWEKRRDLCARVIASRSPDLICLQEAGREQLVENKRTTPADLAAFKLDFAAWLPSLSRRDRRMAEDLAMGERTSDVAGKYGVSASRVSQLRRQMQNSWEEFVGDDDDLNEE